MTVTGVSGELARLLASDGHKVTSPVELADATTAQEAKEQCDVLNALLRRLGLGKKLVVKYRITTVNVAGNGNEAAIRRKYAYKIYVEPRGK